ncbi:tyrosine-type recombinase/integrase [Deinococcus petrolearius]|uniref:Tyrosine-type recombinase/integrase n=1 Tax=Deinococcus petrolearius TaxID=1751295 RepID=A0ABW1DQV4_9DEIO
MLRSPQAPPGPPPPLPALKVGGPAPGSELRGTPFWVLGPQDARVALLRRALRAYDAAVLVEMVGVYDRLRENAQGTAPDGSPRSTGRMYQRGMLVWLAYAQGQGFDLLRDDPMMGTLWVRSLETPEDGRAPLKPATVQTYLAGARHLYACLRRAGLNLNPFADVRVSRDRRPSWERRQPYQGNAVDRLVRFAADVGEPELAYLVSLAADSGLRVSELVMVRFGHLLTADSELRIPSAKRGKSRVVAVSPRTLELFSRLGPGAAAARVFPYTARWFRKRVAALCGQAGVDYKGIHAFRHAHATALVEAGVPLGAVADQLGHANLTSSMPYLKRPGVGQVKRALAGERLELDAQ